MIVLTYPMKSLDILKMFLETGIWLKVSISARTTKKRASPWTEWI
jgi:hypothetical protein